MKSSPILILASLLGATGAFAQTPPPAAAPLFPVGTDPGWLALTCGNGFTSDPVTDAPQGDVNLVGDNNRPAAAILSRGDFLFTRLRLDANPAGPGGFVSQGWSIAFDQDGDATAFEHIVMLSGKDERIEFAQNVNIAKVDDSNEVGERTLQDTSPTSTFAKIELVGDTNGNGVLNVGEVNDPIDGEVANDQDHWVIFAVPWSDPLNPATPTTCNETLNAANETNAACAVGQRCLNDKCVVIATLETEGYTRDDRLRMWFGSSNSARNLSNDIGCSAGVPASLADTSSPPTPLDPNTDDDADTIPNAFDNCRFVANTNQLNSDSATGDTLGDACDVGLQTINEDTTLTFNSVGGNLLRVTNLPEGATGVTLSVSTGVLTLASTTGLTFTVGDGTTDTTMTFTGLRSAIDTALNGLLYVPPLNFNTGTPSSPVTLLLRVTRGTTLPSLNNVAITVTPVDDAPVNTVPGARTINEDTTTSLILSVTDIDSASLTVTLTSTNGTARLASTAGLTSVTGDGTATVTLVGTLATLTTAMNGVVFTPSLNFNGAASLTMLSAGVTASDQDSVAITVSPVNDAPTNGVPGLQTTLEDNALLFSLGTSNALTVSDVDGGSLTVTVAVNSGLLSLGGITGLVFTTGDGTGDATMTFSGTIGDVNAALEGLTFTPNLNFNSDLNGLVTLTLTSRDAAGLTATSNVTIDVDPVNDAPVAVNDTFTVAEDSGATTLDLIANDTDVDADTLVVTAVGTATNATVSVTGGVVRFTPNANFNGSSTFSYTVADRATGGLTATGSVTVTVTPVNDAPDAVNDAVTVIEDTATVLTLLTNDTDIEGNTLTITAVSSTRAVIAANGLSVTYTPALNSNANDSFTYTISDGAGGSDTATVSVTITPVNDAPDAVNDSASTNEDTAVIVNVLGNDTDVDGDTLTVTAAGSAVNGTVEIVTGGVRFVPTANVNGTGSFSYTISDGRNGTDTATVTVTITAVNDAPALLVPGAQTTDEDEALLFSSLGALANGIVVADIDSGALTVTLTADNGTLAVGGPSTAVVTGDGTDTVTLTGTAAEINAALEGLAFLPSDDLNSDADDFALTVDVSDGSLNASSTIEITVDAVNDAPTGGAIAANATEDTRVVIDVITGSADVDGDTLTPTIVTQPAEGGSVSLVDGVVTFAPASNFNGTSVFNVTLSDGNGGTVVRTVTVTVGAVNDAPVVFVPKDQTTDEDTDLTVAPAIAVSDVDGDVLTVTLTSTNGAMTLADVSGITITDGADGTARVVFTGSVAAATLALDGLVFSPATNFNGAASIVVSATDGSLSDTETLGITVVSVNDAPTGGAIAVDIVEDTATPVDVITGAADIDGDTLTPTAVTQPAVGGSVAIVDGAVVFTPAPNFNGTSIFNVTLSDGNGGTVIRTVTVTVTAVNDAPVVTVPGAQTTNEDTALAFTTISVADADADQLTVTVSATNGIVRLGATQTGLVVENDGTAAVTLTGAAGDINAALTGLRFLPTENFNGAAVLTVTAADAALRDTETVGITVVPVNDAPVAANDTESAANNPIDVDVLANDVDIDGDTLRIDDLTVQSGNAGVQALEIVQVGGVDVVRFTPVLGFRGDVTIVVTITDGNLDDTSLLVITVDGDTDGDGEPDVTDNCVDVPNTDQTDTDGDDIGDACDPDDDNDTVLDGDDNCQLVANLDQLNTDATVTGGDALGDACDDDDDADGDLDGPDNCNLIANSDQLDTDNDGEQVSATTGGDACDGDDDNDGVLDGPDNCDLVANNDQLDNETDGIGDACDTDDDNDGDLDVDDNCQFLANSDQLNTDGDTLGNVCDPDDDNDDVLDGPDNCDLVANTAQENNDADAAGDACDDDDDNDGVPDDVDNCQFDANADQNDLDGDDEGDVCDDDRDGDGDPDNDDNCVQVPNADQVDTDGDGAGDACDDDEDGDGDNNGNDNCPNVSNPDQRDTDNDGLGDACDGDDDGDGDEDGDDNCPLVPNADQVNTDGDALGDACDGDDDNDGDDDGDDNCPLVSNANQADLDNDGIGDACDDDRDGDGVNDVDDNCADDANADQADLDNDDEGDVCDGDDDGDGVADVDDNCPTVSNADQIDSNGDGVGDACTGDSDDDGIADTDDNCVDDANADQADDDLDGIGDVCDDSSPYSVGGGGVVAGCGQTDAPSFGAFGLALVGLLGLRRRRQGRRAA